MLVSEGIQENTEGCIVCHWLLYSLLSKYLDLGNKPSDISPPFSILTVDREILVFLRIL